MEHNTELSVMLNLQKLTYMPNELTEVWKEGTHNVLVRNTIRLISTFYCALQKIISLSQSNHT
jgi:hypothetical protein